MIKHQDKKRKQDLGIFYTPAEVVDFIFEILNLWKKNQAKRWKTKEGKQKYPSIIDPAVGEGGFLKAAIEKNFTKPDWIFGLDIDENAVKKWKEINLLKEFGGVDKDLEAHFFHQNGLEKIKWEQHKDKYKYKLKQVDIKNQQFDAVVGNPPYGGIGIKEITPHLEKALFNFQIWKLKSQRDSKYSSDNLGLFGATIPEAFKKKIRNFPIEILFLERFIQLAKPGGWIAIVIPDGILTNSNADYVREYISKKAIVEAIISLPRNTFKNAGTSAKTSILFLRKLKENEKPEKDYPVFLASLENINGYNFQKIIETYQKLYNIKEKNMDKSQLVQITKDQNGREAVMARADKALKELMDEKPSSRWDVNYWHPDIDEIYTLLEKRYGKEKVKTIGNYMKGVYQGDTFRAKKGDEYLKTGGNIIINVTDLLNTGINWPFCKRISESHYNRVKRAEPNKGDLLFIRLGGGSIGRTLVFNGIPGENNIGITGHINRVVLSGLSTYYVDIYLKTYFGQRQIKRFESGTSNQTEFRQEDFAAIFLPVLDQSIQLNIEAEYKKMTVFHNKAMEAKKKGDDNGYKMNLRIAEKMLKDLITKTEAVIRGEREDIV